jgi:uncharacterized membrane protein HdeD (DUF308 family)
MSERGAVRAASRWWIPAIRGSMALVLGVLAIATGNDRSALVNFLGVYWLLSAALTLGWALRVRWAAGSRLGLAAGAVGLVAALLVLLRKALAGVVPAGFLVDAFAVAAILIGTLRLVGAFEVEQRTGRWWTFGGLALGSVEIALGVIVLVAASADARIITAAIGAWGLIGGSLLLMEAAEARNAGRA